MSGRNKMLSGLDLFSGIGGISLALEEWVTPILYVEKDKYAQSVLLSRMVEGTIATAPIFRDVTRLDGRRLAKPVDIIFGGFPCQDISVAGRGKGLAGERSGLFYEIIRLTEEIRPSFVFLENVPAIRTRGLEQVIKEFTKIGYDCRWTCISASSIGANHKRERWFLLAHSNSELLRNKQKQVGECSDKTELKSACENVSYSNKARRMWKDSSQPEKRRNNSEPIGSSYELPYSSSEGLEGQREESCRTEKKQHHASDSSWWESEPDVGRVVNGLPHRVDRIKCLGNSVVPLQVKEAFKMLSGL
jgi:DNA (cytosine-5)-methyltransferase 1